MTDHEAHQRCWNCLYFRPYDNTCILPEESKNEPEPVCPSDSGCGCWEDNPVASWQIVSKILNDRDKHREPELIEKLDSVCRRVDAIVSDLNDLQLYAETLERDLEIMVRDLDEKERKMEITTALEIIKDICKRNQKWQCADCPFRLNTTADWCGIQDVIPEEWDIKPQENLKMFKEAE